MAWPPPLLPTTRTDITTQEDNHPGDHNDVNQAVNDLVVKVQELEGRIVALEP